MSALDHTSDPVEDAATPDAWERALLDRQLQDLGRLAALGMDMAEAIARRVTADDGSAPVADLQHAALDFSRVARAVRLTFALQSRLIADFKGRSKPAAAAEDDDGILEVRWLDPKRPTPAEQKGRAQQAIRRAAHDAGCDTETVERLVLEAGEYLERDDIHALLTRPFEEVVAMICRELAISPIADGLLRTRPPPLAGGDPEGVEGVFRRTNGGDGVPLWSP